MKKEYKTPMLKLIDCKVSGMLCQSREIGGAPVDEEGFPSTVGEYLDEEDQDPYAGHGQGSGGGGNRAPERWADLW